jgi:hypothetical protein
MPATRARKASPPITPPAMAPALVPFFLEEVGAVSRLFAPAVASPVGVLVLSLAEAWPADPSESVRESDVSKGAGSAVVAVEEGIAKFVWPKFTLDVLSLLSALVDCEGSGPVGSADRTRGTKATPHNAADINDNRMETAVEQRIFEV